jgi:hypothetical protein
MAPDPAPPGLARLWRQLTPIAAPHAIDPSELGEYVGLWQGDPARAESAFPEVAKHLAEGCAECDRLSVELLGVIAQTQQITEALRRQRAAVPFLDAFADEPHVLGELRRYQQHRWDTEILANVARLDRELRRRLIR